MIKFLQYIVLMILVGNGLQPYLQDNHTSVDLLSEISEEQHDCSTGEPHSDEEEDQDESTTEDVADSDNSKILEPKPNEFELSSGPSPELKVSLDYPNSVFLSNWTIHADISDTKICPTLELHLHFSKRSYDDSAIA